MEVPQRLMGSFGTEPSVRSLATQPSQFRHRPTRAARRSRKPWVGGNFAPTYSRGPYVDIDNMMASFCSDNGGSHRPCRSWRSKGLWCESHLRGHAARRRKNPRTVRGRLAAMRMRRLWHLPRFVAAIRPVIEHARAIDDSVGQPQLSHRRTVQDRLTCSLMQTGRRH